MTSDAHVAYAEALLHLSARIVGTVRDEGPDAIARVIDEALIVEAPPGVDPAVALITVLAAQVEVDRPNSQRLGWLTDRQIVDDVLRLRRLHYGTAAA